MKRKRLLSIFLAMVMLLGLFSPAITVSNAAQNVALNKTATASSSYNSANTPDKAFDGNPGTRWESEYSDPQWITVDLGKSYNITGVKIVWENAAGKEYKIQVSENNVNWTDVYTVTNGTMAHVLDVTFQPVSGRYVRMYGTQRVMGYGYSIWDFEVYAEEGGPTQPTQNLALNKPAATSSYIGGNTAAMAFDGNAGTRWESEYSDPQWISVDLGKSYNITGLKIVWENAAGKEYKIQVSDNNTNWTDVYTVTNGTMAHVLDISFSGVSGRYVRMYGTQRAMIYGYSIWEFEVYGTDDGTPPVGSINPPSGLGVTSYTTNSISLSWNPVSGATGYNIYRSFTPSGTYMKVNTTPVSSTSYTDNGLDTATYYYKVSAVKGSEESALSGYVSATTILDFGPNVKIFDPSMPASTIQNTVNDIYDRMAPADSGQFSSERYALLFKPGTYDTFVNVGYYTQVLGLGLMPDQTSINGLACWPNLPNNNATCNFWRGAENLAVNSDTVWAVSQAVSLRRVHIRGELSLHWYGGWTSGGFMSDCIIDGRVVPGSQQQWFSRNSKWAQWANGVWNMVFAGCVNAPAPSYPDPPYTVINQTPISREKPFLYLDGSEFKVFVPNIRLNSVGVSWENGVPAGQSLSMSQFVIAHPETFKVDTLNQALSQGKHIMFTPGIYRVDKPLMVTNPNTIIMGLGLATLTPTNGNACMKIADVSGVIVTGLLFDAGAINSPVLLEVGPEGSSANHSSNPTFLSDLYFRVGGAAVGRADVCIIINSNHVVGDNFWVWRADHGAGVGWYDNTTKNGIIVNGDYVTLYALMVEHFHEYQTVWNGEYGRTYFYQSEIPYDVPSQAAWMSHNGTKNGFASYKVADHVNNHETWGMGIYSYFRDAPVKLHSAVESPIKPGVKHHNTCTVWLAGDPASEITHVINDSGNAAVQGAQMRQYIAEYP